MTPPTNKTNETSMADKEPQILTDGIVAAQDAANKNFTCPNCGFNPKEHAEQVKKGHGGQTKT